MNVVDVINKKRLGEVLSVEEISYMVNGFVEERIPDYQMSALLMAICLNGMTKEETVELTKIMRDSGDVIDLSGIDGIKVDKHSTGGVGDKTTLIVAPIAAACGIPIAKMSGRGLGFTGGTIDKLESIPGFRTSMTQEEFVKGVNEIGIAVTGQTGHIAPADKKIYALRDVTATTESISLITSSIMSKKLAAGTDAIVLDVKCGKGAFMKNYEDSKALAQWMVDIGKMSGKRIVAIISDMNQPLGNAVGNALEVREAIDVLNGKGPKDLTELSLNLAAAMIALGSMNDGENFEKAFAEGKAKAKQALDSGAAIKKFKEFVAGQWGNDSIVERPKLLPSAKHKLELKASRDGYVKELDAMKIGLASQHVGAGRARKEDSIDMSAGIYLKKKCGDAVKHGDVLCYVYGNDLKKVQMGMPEVEDAYLIESNDGSVMTDSEQNNENANNSCDNNNKFVDNILIKGIIK